MTAGLLDLLAPQGDQVVESPDYWRAYSPDTTDDDARRLFSARFGEPPATVIRSRGLVLAGPLTPSQRRRSGPAGETREVDR